MYQALRVALGHRQARPGLMMHSDRRNQYANQLEAVKDMTEYIVGFYNSVRRRSALGNIAPLAYEKQFVANHPIGVSEIT